MTAVDCVTEPEQWPLLTLSRLLVFSHLPPFYLRFLFKWSGYQTSAKTTRHKRKRCQGTVKSFVCIFAVLHLLAYILLPCRTWIFLGLNLPSQCPLLLVSVDIQSLTWAQLKWTQAAPSVLHYSFNSAEKSPAVTSSLFLLPTQLFEDSCASTG